MLRGPEPDLCEPSLPLIELTCPAADGQVEGTLDLARCGDELNRTGLMPLPFCEG
jgi:hypothetical protein